MASPTLALDSTMVFTLPSNASQALYPDNTVTDFRVALPEHVALRSNDYEVALASFTYARSWYNVPDLAGQTHTATVTFLVGHLYPPLRDGSRAEEETATAETEGTAEMPPSHPCEGSTFMKSRRTLSPGYYEHIKQMLHDLDWHGGGSRMGFQFSYNAVRDRVLVDFRPGLKNCTGQVALSQPLSLLLGWPGQPHGPRQRTPHGPLSTQTRPGGEPFRALRPCRRHSHGRQCQELPVSRSAYRRSPWSGRVLQASAIGLAARAACAEGRCAHGQRRAQRKDHETGPQKPRGPLGRWPGAGSHGSTHQKARHSAQMTSGQEASPRRYLCLIKKVGP